MRLKQFVAAVAIGIMALGLTGCGGSASGSITKTDQYVGSWWAESRDRVTGKQPQILTVNIKKNGENYIVERIVENSTATRQPETATATLTNGVLKTGGGIELTYLVDEKMVMMPWATRDNMNAQIKLKRANENTETEKQAIRNRPDWKNKI